MRNVVPRSRFARDATSDRVSSGTPLSKVLRTANALATDCTTFLGLSALILGGSAFIKTSGRCASPIRQKWSSLPLSARRADGPRKLTGSRKPHCNEPERDQGWLSQQERPPSAPCHVTAQSRHRCSMRTFVAE